MSNPSITFTLLPDLPEPAGGPIGASAYARMLKGLLPPGKVWRLDADGTLSALFLANGDELERVDARGQDLVVESDPRTTDELMPEFERVLGIVADGTLEERRARVVATLLRRQRFRPVDFQTVLAPVLGLDPADVIVLETSRADAIAAGDDRLIYLFHIYRNPALPGSYDLAAAQDLVDRMKPSHTEGRVMVSTGFLCDDPDSLCDRDLLGV